MRHIRQLISLNIPTLRENATPQHGRKIGNSGTMKGRLIHIQLKGMEIRMKRMAKNREN